jgi:hypothetical protein
MKLAPVSYFAILLARSYESVERLPADPGYDYILDGSEHGLRALMHGDPYFHFMSRLLALVTSWFPLANQVIVLSLLVHGLWTGCAMIIASVITKESGQKLLGYLAGLVLITAPHASESGLGNVGNVKWPMIAALLTVCCSHEMIARYPMLISIGAVATGFTQPLTILCGMPLALNLTRKRQFSRGQLLVAGALAMTFLIQIAKVGIDLVLRGQSAKVTSPWAGMGLFWWSGLIGPIVIAAFCLAILLVRRSHDNLSWFATKLALVVVVLSIASYSMGGIGDRYFIAPMSLAIVTTFLVQTQLFERKSKLWGVSWAILLLFLAIPTAKWFSSSSYLIAPPEWGSEISRVTQLCEIDKNDSIAVSSSKYGGNDLECSYILRG